MFIVSAEKVELFQFYIQLFEIRSMKSELNLCNMIYVCSTSFIAAKKVSKK